MSVRLPHCKQPISPEYTDSPSERGIHVHVHACIQTCNMHTCTHTHCINNMYTDMQHAHMHAHLHAHTPDAHKKKTCTFNDFVELLVVSFSGTENTIDCNLHCLYYCQFLGSYFAA